ncbi:MAG: group III truncated hemoglobin [Hyphomicrobium sp.]
MTHPKAPGFSLGITDTMIRGLVDAFYAKVRDDAVLGPIFEAKIHDWEEHLAKLTDFWSSIVLMSGRYKGRPMPVHAAIPEISDEHFLRWLKLFGDTTEEVCPPQAALLFKDRAMRIAESLKAGIAIQRREAAASP